MLRRAGEMVVILYMGTVICLTGLAGLAVAIGWPAVLLMLVLKACRVVT